MAKILAGCMVLMFFNNPIKIDLSQVIASYLPWYLQIVSRYEHSDLTYDCTGSVEFPGTSTSSMPIHTELIPAMPEFHVEEHIYRFNTFLNRQD